MIRLLTVIYMQAVWPYLGVKLLIQVIFLKQTQRLWCPFWVQSLHLDYAKFGLFMSQAAQLLLIFCNCCDSRTSTPTTTLPSSSRAASGLPRTCQPSGSAKTRPSTTTLPGSSGSSGTRRSPSDFAASRPSSLLWSSRLRIAFR